MDLPRPELLKQLRLHVSTEGPRLVHFVHDLGSGAIVSVSRAAVWSLYQFETLLGTPAGQPRPAMTNDEAREGYVALSFLRSIRDRDRLKRTNFNPLFMKVDLFDVGRFQTYFAGFARLVIGWPLAIAMAAMAVAVLYLGTLNNWAIGVEFGNVFSLRALATFALLAPFLKLIHEAGHVMFATWAGVRVRKAGFNLIGLYPMPFVDCSEADLTASRRGRILISLAGIITDVAVGMVAFILWHFVEGDFLHSLAGRVLAFNTINSILFNANPLMKMDGYYALVDVMGRRNLSTRAGALLSALRSYVLTMGAKGTVPKGWAECGATGYGFATMLFRLSVLFGLFLQVAPQYLGLGLAVSVWGGYAMFGSPLLADQRPAKQALQSGDQVSKQLRRALVPIGALVLMAFLPLPFALRLDLSLDVDGRYALTSAKGGFIDGSISHAPLVLKAGQPALRLTNEPLLREIEVMALKEQEAQMILDSVRAINAGQSEVASDKIVSVGSKADLLRSEAESLVVKARTGGIFLPSSGLRTGQYLADGAVVGQFFPDAGASTLIGAFPERWVEKLQAELSSAELWDQQHYAPVDRARLRLVEKVQIDQTNGTRSFDIEVTYDAPPSSLIGKDVQLRLDFGWQPVWRHIGFWAEGRLQAFRDAQLADRVQRIE